MMKRSHPLHQPTGYALIEVLVTLVVLLIGLLGLAGVNARANVSEFESYQRIQALALLQDMVDRLNANRAGAPCYSNGTTGFQTAPYSVPAATSGVPASCTLPATFQGQPISTTPGPIPQALLDLTEWETMLQGSAEYDPTKPPSTRNVGAMIGAIGCIRQIDATNQIYLISVSWQGLADTVAPTDAAGATATCGYGSYGTELRHRMVTATVQIAKLV